MKKISFKKKQQVRMMNSFGETNWELVVMTYNIEVDTHKRYGCFEMVSGCGTYYTEGGLWFTDGELVDYDGIFELPTEIEDQLKKWGYKVD
jgi:hypothetical protein